MPPITEPRTVDFGIGIGKRQCFLYNLPETESCHVNLRVPSVSARFGTAPFFWNWAMWLTARLSPKGAACRTRSLMLDQLLDTSFSRISISGI